ncbi:hypothetical protein AVEN_70141-1 [Araneus ventricosus]|uniref:Uncharacterized protein n=1 Tax=Araneus ventricosus TaxID=182803 RepID=A0A4Y2EK62_ARAVE|nr:hypothetical protein AVEN_70141-1 [Araneus ventricosus]
MKSFGHFLREDSTVEVLRPISPLCFWTDPNLEQDHSVQPSPVQLAEKAFRVTGIEPYNPDIISEDCCSPPLVTLAPLDNDRTLAVAPEENEVSPSTSRIDVSTHSIVPLPRHKQRGAKKKRKSQKSDSMSSSSFKNLLEKKEKVELEEAKANRALKKNKNGDKTEKGKSPKQKKNSF